MDADEATRQEREADVGREPQEGSSDSISELMAHGAEDRARDRC
jgi:hypothetical protein